jgi:hypothetical protein
MQITTIGLDIAKNVFRVHGIDAAEKVVVLRQRGMTLIRDELSGLFSKGRYSRGSVTRRHGAAAAR